MLGKSLRERRPESPKSTFRNAVRHTVFSLSYFMRFTLIVFGGIKSLYQSDTMIGTRCHGTE